ncbi:hypothetical protein LUZ60_013372 [Juncus effusus]|nr:hypothetical protein LUZ60_013372 [Juncus effusus]
MAASSARPWIPLLLFVSCCLFLAMTVSGANNKLPQPANSGKKFGKRSQDQSCLDEKTNHTKCTATCPTRCPNSCLVICPYCQTLCPCDIPGAICGDPRFTGGDGNVFYFHGKKDQDFCVVSDPDVHINAHFIGKRNPSMNRDFTWVQALGILFGDKRLYIGVQKTMIWNDESEHLIITFNGVPVDIPAVRNAKWVPTSVPALSIKRTSNTNGVTMELRGVLTIRAHAVPITEEDSKIHNYGVTDDDSLAHLDLSFKFHSLSDDVHGVLGQTYRPDYVNKLDMTKRMPIMGGGPSYLSSGIFSTDCAVSRFHGKPDLMMVTGTDEY